MTAQITMTPTLQPLLSTTARLATVVAVAAVVALTWVAAGQASHEAAHTMSAALSPSTTVTRVTRPRVDIVGRRDDSRPAPLANAGLSATTL
jgi:hypothetical protein